MARVPQFILPLPSEVVGTFVAKFPILLANSWVTISESLIGFGIALAAGVAMAVVIAYSPLASTTILPTIIVLESIPKVALAPLIVVWLGLGMSAKIATVAVMCFFPVFMNTVRGLTRVDQDFVDLIDGLGGTKWTLFTTVRLPWAVPHAFTGLRIAVPLAMIGAVIGEFISSQQGLGYLVLSASQHLDTALMFAAIALITIWSSLIYQAVSALERFMAARFPTGPTS